LAACAAAGARTVADPLDRTVLLDAAAPATGADGLGWSRAGTGQALVPAAATAPNQVFPSSEEGCTPVSTGRTI
jgi:hypothetical protein